MTGPMNDDELTPEQEAEITALLADAATPVSLPAEVSARLDSVLADLVAEREAAPSNVVPFKRRRWPQVLVAAAAVTVFGYAGSSYLGGMGASDDKASSGADGAFEVPETTTNGDSSAPPKSMGTMSAGPQDAAGGAGKTPLGNSPGPQEYATQDASKALNGVDQLAKYYEGYAFNANERSAVLDDGVFLLQRNVQTKCTPAVRARDLAYSTGHGKKAVVLLVRNGKAPGPHVVRVYDCEHPLFPARTYYVLSSR